MFTLKILWLFSITFNLGGAIGDDVNVKIIKTDADNNANGTIKLENENISRSSSDSIELPKVNYLVAEEFAPGTTTESESYLKFNSDEKNATQIENNRKEHGNETLTTEESTIDYLSEYEDPNILEEGTEDDDFEQRSTEINLYETVEDIFNETGAEIFDNTTIGNLADIIQMWLNEQGNEIRNIDVDVFEKPSPPATTSENTSVSKVILRRNDSTESQINKPVVTNVIGHDSKNVNRTKNSDVVVITENRMAFSDYPDILSARTEPIAFGNNSSSTEINEETDDDARFLYGTMRNGNGDTCISLNLTMEMFVNGTKLHLRPNVEIESTRKDEAASVTFSWYDVNRWANLSVGFEIRGKDEYYFVDTINVELRKYDGQRTVELLITKGSLKLFPIKIGSNYEGYENLTFEMEDGIAINLKWIDFSVYADFDFEDSRISYALMDHYKEVIGIMIGLILLVFVIIFVVGKMKKRKDLFAPTAAVC